MNPYMILREDEKISTINSPVFSPVKNMKYYEYYEKLKYRIELQTTLRKQNAVI